MQLLLIGGRSGAGKTTVASAVFDTLAALDVRHAWVEGDFLDLAHPTPWKHGLSLAEDNLHAIWRNYTKAGYSRLIYSNSAAVLPDVSTSLIRAIGGHVETTAVLLRATDASVRLRLEARESGATLDAHLKRSALMAGKLDEAAADSVVRVDTDGRTAESVAREIVGHLDWA